MKKQVTGDFWIPIDNYYVETVGDKECLRLFSSLRFDHRLDNDKLDRLIELLEMYRDYRNDKKLNAIFELGNTYCSLFFRQGFPTWERYGSSTAVVKRDGKFVEIGDERNNFDLQDGDAVVRPLVAGEIADKEAAQYLVREMVVERKKLLFQGSEISKMLMIVPATFSTQEIDLLREALQETGAKDVRFIYRPLAEAICLGYDIYEPEAKMIVRCGGGVTEISVIALGGIVTSKTLPFAGKLFTKNTCEYLLKRHNLLVDEEHAEQAMLDIGFRLMEENVTGAKEIVGMNPDTNKLENIVIFCMDIELPNEELLRKIDMAVMEVLESIPPEMAYDILFKTKRIALTGGSARFPELDIRLKDVVGDYCSKHCVTDAEGNRVSEQESLSEFDVLVKRIPINPNPFLELMHFDRFDFLIK